MPRSERRRPSSSGRSGRGSRTGSRASSSCTWAREASFSPSATRRSRNPRASMPADGSGTLRRWPSQGPRAVDWFELAVSLVLILLAAELFTNGIEWVGETLGLSEGAVGSVLAAVGTALPETLLPLVAIAIGHPQGEEIGIGAILGAPFMLSTL